MPHRGEIRPKPIAACAWCGSSTCYAHCVNPPCGSSTCYAHCVNPPEPDDFEVYNQNEADEYRDEGGEA